MPSNPEGGDWPRSVSRAEGGGGLAKAYQCLGAWLGWPAREAVVQELRVGGVRAVTVGVIA